MKQGDIVIFNHENIALNFLTPYPSILTLYEINSPIQDKIIIINTLGIPNHNQKDWRVYKNDFRLATKEDLKEYLDFIFTNEKIWFRYDNISEANLLSKIINNKYPYNRMKLPETSGSILNNYFNRKQLWFNIKEEEWLSKGYAIIKVKDLKYMIRKIYGKEI